MVPATLQNKVYLFPRRANSKWHRIPASHKILRFPPFPYFLNSLRRIGRFWNVVVHLEKSEHCQRFVFAKLTRLYTMRIGGCASHFSFAFGRCNRRTRLKGTWFAKNVRSAVKLLSLPFFAHAGQSPFNGKPSHKTTGFCKIWGWPYVIMLPSETISWKRGRPQLPLFKFSILINLSAAWLRQQPAALSLFSFTIVPAPKTAACRLRKYDLSIVFHFEKAAVTETCLGFLRTVPILMPVFVSVVIDSHVSLGGLGLPSSSEYTRLEVFHQMRWKKVNSAQAGIG